MTAAIKQRTKASAPNARGDEWYTPPWLIRELGGPFDLDPCCPRPGHWTARTCWTIEDDGLSKPWKGEVFLNPPYSKSTLWADRMRTHRNGVMLVPVRNSWWFQELAVGSCWAWALLQTKIRFCDIQGAPLSASADVFALIAWGKASTDRVRRALLRSEGLLPGEAPAAKLGERIRGRLYVEEIPHDMRHEIGQPMGLEIDAADEEASGAFAAEVAKKGAGVSHRIYKDPKKKAAAVKARARPQAQTQRSTP